MSGRRSYARVRVASPWSGAMRVARDVSVRRTPTGDLEVISRVPGVIDEELMLELSSNGDKVQLRVKVTDSRPIVIDGDVRHQLKLLTLGVG